MFAKVINIILVLCVCVCVCIRVCIECVRLMTPIVKIVINSINSIILWFYFRCSHIFYTDSQYDSIGVCNAMKTVVATAHFESHEFRKLTGFPFVPIRSVSFRFDDRSCDVIFDVVASKSADKKEDEMDFVRNSFDFLVAQSN